MCRKTKAPPIATPIIVVPIIIKCIVPIPKVSKSESSSQTCIEGTGMSSDLLALDLGTQTDISSDDFLPSTFLFDQEDSLDQGVQTNPIDYCEFGTQTSEITHSFNDWSEPLPRPPLHVESHDLSLTDLLNSSSCIDFGTQTLDINDQLFDLRGQARRDQESQT